MTATAQYVHTNPVCPKCGGAMWDQKSSKFWGNGLTKNGKTKPRYECKNKECGGAVWEPKVTVTTTPAPKPAYVQPQIASKPNSQLPPLLQNAEAEDNAELAAKVGFDVTKIQGDLSLYQSITEWYLATMVPVLTKADVGCSPESVNAAVATIFIQAKK